MSSNYEQINQFYQELISNFSNQNHKLEAFQLFESFWISFQKYLGCTKENIHLFNQKSQIVHNIEDAIYRVNNAPVWILWFAVDLVARKDLNLIHKYGIKIYAEREEMGWNVRVASFEQNFLIQVNEQETTVPLNLDSFNELNKFIYEKIQEDLPIHFGRFLDYGKEVEKENSFGFVITPTE